MQIDVAISALREGSAVATPVMLALILNEIKHIKSEMKSISAVKATHNEVKLEVSEHARTCEGYSRIKSNGKMHQAVEVE
jgi:hypothetical protein